MLLSLLAFFVPPVLGALVNRASAPIADKTRSRRYAVLVLLACIAYEVLAFRVPIRAVWSELVMSFTGAVVVVFIMLAIPLEAGASPKGMPRRNKSSENGGCASAAVMLLLPLVSFTLVGRVDHAQKIGVKWNGYVVSKYRSHNHAAPSFELSNGDEIEGVDRTTWDAATKGSRLDKPAWSAFGEMDGRHVRMVPELKVMFLGPFRD